MPATDRRRVAPSTVSSSDRVCIIWPGREGVVNTLCYRPEKLIRTYAPDAIDPRAIVSFTAETRDDVIRGLQAEPVSKNAFAVPVRLAISVLGFRRNEFADA